jgi:uncharacterized protein (TIGR02266 family)
MRAMNEAPRQRVKVVSLKVGYKSATVDEFIERHALDVNRAGIYLQTAHPLPIGTKLKIEIQIAGGLTVMAAFGRVVWKRDGTPANAVLPPGMGVRFIKLDEPSTKLLDDLVSARPDAGLAYEEGIEKEPEDMPRAVARLESSPAEAMFPPAEPAAEVAPDEELTVMTRMDDILDELIEEPLGTEPEGPTEIVARPGPTSPAPEAPTEERSRRQRRIAGPLVVIGAAAAVALALTTYRRGLHSGRPAAVAGSTAEAVQELPVGSAPSTASSSSPIPPAATAPASADVPPVAQGTPAATATATAAPVPDVAMTSDVRPKPPIVRRKPAAAPPMAGASSKPKWLLHPSKVDNPY